MQVPKRAPILLFNAPHTTTLNAIDMPRVALGLRECECAMCFARVRAFHCGQDANCNIESAMTFNCSSLLLENQARSLGNTVP